MSSSCLFEDYGIIFPSKTSIFIIVADYGNLLKSDPTTEIFLKMFNNFERLVLVFHKRVGDTLLKISLFDKIYVN